MATALKECTVCEKQFLVKFRYQIERTKDGVEYYCSNQCRQDQTAERGQVPCSGCGRDFEPKYAFQQATVEGKTVHYCSMECRKPAVNDYRRRTIQAEQGPMRIAILNQKGGTGKTTTTVNLGAGLAKQGLRVLIIDVDSQGHVGVSLGVSGKKTLYHVLVEGAALEECTVSARPNLDILPADDTLASAEIFLARLDEDRDKMLRKRLLDVGAYDIILLDCGPSLSLLNMNALTFADHLIVPVACDFLSLVGVKQVMKTLRNVNRVLLHPISVMGILPTFYDMRNKISDEAVKTLQGHFHDKVLPPVRVNTRLKEAPSESKTIFEYAPESRGASDYRRLVTWVIKQQEQRLQATA
ncbi:AAA family ATPase [Bradymonas sediminis]|nr:AAA family ATPase [Bradymonas sediminis]TDP72170.1 chromosome partitioning protein [Bradymonas sediminis]